MAGFVASETSRVSLLLTYVEEFMDNAGDTLSFEQMLDVCDMADVEHDRAVLSSVVADVNKRLHRNGDWKQLIAVRNVGYRIATPAEARADFLDRSRHVDRQLIANVRAAEKLVRHPDATAAERKRAADAASQAATIRMMVQRDHRKLKRAWVAEEESPVFAE